MRRAGQNPTEAEVQVRKTIFFLSPLLGDCSLCWDRWNGAYDGYTLRGPAIFGAP